MFNSGSKASAAIFAYCAFVVVGCASSSAEVEAVALDDDAIINGQGSGSAENFVVAVGYVDPNQTFLNHCTGVLIAERVVLSSDDCLKLLDDDQRPLAIGIGGPRSKPTVVIPVSAIRGAGDTEGSGRLGAATLAADVHATIKNSPTGGAALSSSIVFPTLAETAPQNGQAIRAVGYGPESASRLFLGIDLGINLFGKRFYQDGTLSGIGAEYSFVGRILRNVKSNQVTTGIGACNNDQGAALLDRSGSAPTAAKARLLGIFIESNHECLVDAKNYRSKFERIDEHKSWLQSLLAGT